MAAKPSFHEGERWELRTTVKGFAPTLVIGRVFEGWGREAARYHVYIRFNEEGRAQLPPDFDGVILSMTAAAIRRHVGKLIASDVRLPWWWIYGRRCKNRKLTPTHYRASSWESIDEALRSELSSALQTTALEKQVIDCLDRHAARFLGKRKRMPAPKTVAEAWARISTWMTTHAPKAGFTLNPGASHRELDAFEMTIGSKLPNDVRESWSLHNGGGWIPPRRGDLMSLEMMALHWNMYREWKDRGDYAVDNDDWNTDAIKGPIKHIFWNLKRIPLTENSGNHVMLDLDPPARGSYGQIIHHSHEVGPTEILASSWLGFLQRLVAEFESGELVYLELEHDATLYQLDWVRNEWPIAFAQWEAKKTQ